MDTVTLEGHLIVWAVTATCAVIMLCIGFYCRGYVRGSKEARGER